MELIAIATEPWEDCRDEVMAYWPAHWQEVALDKDRVPLDPNVPDYDAKALAGQLSVVTVRKYRSGHRPDPRGELVGYHITVVSPHLHYKSTLCGFVDVYWLRPDCRAGWTGVNLFKAVERSLRARGVVKVYSGTKKHLDAGALFEHLGWTEAERLFCKTL